MVVVDNRGPFRRRCEHNEEMKMAQTANTVHSALFIRHEKAVATICDAHEFLL